MARAAKATKTIKSATTGRKPGRPAGIAVEAPAEVTRGASSPKRVVVASEAPERRKPGRPATKAAVGPPSKAARAAKAPPRAPAAPPAPKVSKGELRAQVDKLELVVAALRAKSRETNRAAKAAAARIAELEAQVVRLEKKAATPAPTTNQKPQTMKPLRAKRQSREIDPGDAVLPGVAVQEPAPLDEQAETALENLEEHLSQT